MAGVLSPYGGYMTSWGTTSWGTWPEVYPNMQPVSASNGARSGNDRLRHAARPS